MALLVLEVGSVVHLQQRVLNILDMTVGVPKFSSIDEKASDDHNNDDASDEEKEGESKDEVSEGEEEEEEEEKEYVKLTALSFHLVAKLFQWRQPIVFECWLRLEDLRRN